MKAIFLLEDKDNPLHRKSFDVPDRWKRSFLPGVELILPIIPLPINLLFFIHKENLKIIISQKTSKGDVILRLQNAKKNIENFISNSRRETVNT